MCTSCKAGETFKSVSGQSVKCAPVSQCKAGEEEVIAPTAMQDRQCRACEVGVTFKPKAGQDTRCAKVVSCGPTEYMTQAATTTTDTQCSLFTVCAQDEYESEAPARDKNRKCSKCTLCPQGRFQIRACSASQDAQCAGCLACPAGQYKGATCTNTTNTVCIACRDCHVTEYLTQPCSIDSPPTCDALTVCTAQEYETLAATKTSNRKCAPLTKCASDEYEIVSATATSDRKCGKVTVCRPGEEESSAPGPTQNRVCTPCPAGLIDSDNNGQSRCAPCPTGSYVPGGQTGSCTPYLCPGGQADLDQKPDTPCESCEFQKSFSASPGAFVCTKVKDCEAGAEQVVPPTLFADRICSPCLEGVTFKVDAGQDAKCQFVKRCDFAKQFEAKAPTRTSDRVCKDLKSCSSSEYQIIPPSESTDRVCTALTPCDTATQYQLTAPTPLTDRVCRNVTRCLASEYESKTPTSTSNRECMPITVCNQDQIEVRPPTSTSDRLCNPIFRATIYFAANFDEVVGTEEGYNNFTASLAEALTNNSIDASKIINYNLTAGSIVAELTALDSGIRIAIFDLASTGDLVVQGYVARPCPGKQFLFAPVTDYRDPPRCADYSVCHRYEYVSRPHTFTSDLECSTLTVCPPGEEEILAPSITSDRLCGAIEASTGSSGMSAGISAAIAVLVVLVLIVVVMFVVWRRRKVSKDKRHEELVEKMARAMGSATVSRGNDFSEGNRMLRELTLQSGSVMLFDNPTFRPAVSGDGYLDTRPDWLAGTMSREDAEAHLRANSGQVGDFVIRESSTNGNFVLSILVKDGLFEHHKLYQDAHARWLLNGNRFSKDCRSLHEVVVHLSQVLDGTSVLLNFVAPDADGNTYGKVVKPEEDSYGKVTKPVAEQAEFYGSVAKQKPAWQRGEMTRKAAEDELQKNPVPGAFLVRESKGNFALSMVIDDGRMEHHVLKSSNGSFYLNESRLPAHCNSLETVVEHLYDNLESMSCKLKRPAGYDMLPAARNPLFDAKSPRSVVNPGYNTLPRKPHDPGYQEPQQSYSMLPEESYLYNKDLSQMGPSALSNPGYQPGFALRGAQGADYFDPQPYDPSATYDAHFPRDQEETMYSNADTVLGNLGSRA